MTEWVAPHSTRWFGPGEHCADPRDGDVLIVDHGTVWSRVLIFTARLFAWLHPSLRAFVWCDHIAFIRMVNGVPFVSEMGPTGHRLRALAHYQSRLYCIVTFAVSDEDRGRVVAADERLGALEYGWGEYPAQAVNGITGLHLAVTGRAMDCSAAVALCGWNIYWNLNGPPQANAPWDMARAVGAARP